MGAVPMKRTDGHHAPKNVTLPSLGDETKHGQNQAAFPSRLRKRRRSASDVLQQTAHTELNALQFLFPHPSTP